MPLRKTAIAVSDALLDAVDRAARSRGETRNRFITRVLEAAVRARRDADVTRRLNALFAAPEIAEAHRAETAALDDVGVAWDEERW
jgi:metal-responsive CopG/Arc/MetJ family transcriptional regulator